MRESDRLVSQWVREGGRLKKRERERERDREREGGVKQMCQNCIPKMNMNTLWNTPLAPTLGSVRTNTIPSYLPLSTNDYFV